MGDFIFGYTAYNEQIVAQQQQELGTVWHNHRIEPRDPLPGQPVKILVDVGVKFRADAVHCYWTTDSEQPFGKAGKATCGHVLSLEYIGPIWKDLVWGYVNRWQGFIPPQREGVRVRYRIEAWDGQQKTSAFADNGSIDPLQNPPFAYHVDRWQTPDWIRDAIIYQVLVDRFYPGDGQNWKNTTNLSSILGGTLRGVTDQLPYFSSLGINTLWISPISEGPSWHHYNTSNHRTVAAHLGKNEDFRELVKKAHEAGIRILLDFVVHGTSNEHPYLKAAQADRQSPYYPWYTFKNWPDDYDCFFTVKELPHLNLEHKQARQYIIDTALQWLVDYGVDGFRLDYAIKPSFDFWIDMQSQLRDTSPECFTVAEAVASPAHLLNYEGKLDGCLDFIMCEALRSTFAYQKNSLVQFINFLERHELYGDKDFIHPTFIDNHDMNRILFAADGDKRKVILAAACQFTLSQPPIVLYGTEVGLSQKTDSKGDLDVIREPMLWDKRQDHDLWIFYQKLCRVRNRYPSLRRGERKTRWVDDQTLVFSKGSGDFACLVALYMGDSEKSVSVEANDLPAQLTDALSGASYEQQNSTFVLHLTPWQACILVPEG